MGHGHIAFDLDQTIVQSSAIYGPVIEAFCAEMGLPCYPDKIAAGYVTPDKTDLGWNMPLHEQPAMYKKLEAYHVREMRVHQRYVPEVFAGILEAIKELSKDYDLSIITANTYPIAEEFINQHALGRYIKIWRSLCCARERNYEIKPSPEAFFCIVRESGYEANRAMIVGDSASDINMAHAAKVKSVAALWGASSIEKIMACNPTAALKTAPEPVPAAHLLLQL